MEIKLIPEVLSNKTVLLTGAGGGIGFEAAKAFAEMGAKVLIAEINREKGIQAAAHINQLYPNKAEFFNTDLSNEADLGQLCENILFEYGCPDFIFNNAAMVVTGAIGEVDISEWDYSYAVNLKAPILLTTLFLKQMKKRNSGCIVFVSSSGAAPYLGGYEVFKTAQAEFSSTLALELEGTNIYAYTIAPGLVKTATAEKSIEVVASKMNVPLEQFYQMNADFILDAEIAGKGFAVSVLKADEYHGQEISSIQALHDFDSQGKENVLQGKEDVSTQEIERIKKIIDTFQSQYSGWQERNIFERQWVLRDFKKCVGQSADAVQKEFQNIENAIENNDGLRVIPKNLLEKLKLYWQRQLKLLQGFEKNSNRRAENSKIIQGWIDDIQAALGNVES